MQQPEGNAPRGLAEPATPGAAKRRFSRADAIRLALGAVIYLAALALTPGELAAARARPRTQVDLRSAATLVCYLAATILILGAMPRRVA